MEEENKEPAGADEKEKSFRENPPAG